MEHPILRLCCLEPRSESPPFPFDNLVLFLSEPSETSSCVCFEVVSVGEYDFSGPSGVIGGTGIYSFPLIFFRATAI